MLIGSSFALSCNEVILILSLRLKLKINLRAWFCIFYNSNLLGLLALSSSIQGYSSRGRISDKNKYLLIFTGADLNLKSFIRLNLYLAMIEFIWVVLDR